MGWGQSRHGLRAWGAWEPSAGPCVHSRRLYRGTGISPCRWPIALVLEPRAVRQGNRTARFRRILVSIASSMLWT
jgi:hypothetical protein